VHIARFWAADWFFFCPKPQVADDDDPDQRRRDHDDRAESSRSPSAA